MDGTGLMPDVIADSRDSLLRCRTAPAMGGYLPDLTEAQAYAVQAQVAAALGDTVRGWKVAIVAGRPVGAPLLGATLLLSGQSFDCPAGVDVKIETELGFTLKRDLAPGPIRRDDLLDAIDSVHAAFEIVGARIGEPPAVPFACFLADYLGNAATVIGPGRTLEALPIRGRLDRNGALLAEGAHPSGDPLAALLAFAELQPDALGGLRRGQVIITGSFTGATKVAGSDVFRGQFDGLAPVEVTFTRRGDDLMALAGSAVVAIWNDITPEGRDNFYEWHNREHMPERLGIDGFLRGRRYIAVEGALAGMPHYFTLYEVRDAEVLGSDAYLARLNSPTPWTTDSVKHFRNVARSLCRNDISHGTASGGFLATLRFDCDAASDAALMDRMAAISALLMSSAGIVACHVSRADLAVSTAKTAEQTGRPDNAIPRWVVMIEGSTVAAVRGALANQFSAAALSPFALTDAARGVYALQFDLLA